MMIGLWSGGMVGQGCEKRPFFRSLLQTNSLNYNDAIVRFRLQRRTLESFLKESYSVSICFSPE
ncbi:hypothetical protein Pjdr2_5775 [Paenibacillus sp. JDR-2]|nr:hypothetical protein Pjdr2_5775 [Paenibacillus sp. JDR-2]